MKEELQDLPINIEIYRTYERDKLTKWVKSRINRMTVSEVSKAFNLSINKSEQIKTRLSKAFLLSDLAVYDKMSISQVQPLYDFGFDCLITSQLADFNKAE